jgi:hypothetical protein
MSTTPVPYTGLTAEDRNRLPAERHAWRQSVPRPEQEGRV